MIKIFFIASLIPLLSIFNTDDVSVSNKTFLTGQGSKSWYLYSTSPESTSATCQSSHAINLDNTYIFSADGSFEFDHGAITKDETCNDDCCSDMVNMVGTWKFTNGEKGIKITVLHEKNATENMEKMVLYNASIVQLDEQVLKINQEDPDTKEMYSFEFRSK